MAILKPKLWEDGWIMNLIVPEDEGYILVHTNGSIRLCETSNGTGA